MNPSGKILSVDGPEHLAWIRELFVEYARALGFHICFEGFEKELGQLPGIYAPPEGRLFLALVGSRAAGCVAIKKSAENVCELKRLYVRPEFRGQHLGSNLVAAALTEAQAMGYRKVELDTLPEMKAAQAIYRAAGFRDKDAPAGDTLLMEMELL